VKASVERAHQRIRDVVRCTPCLRSPALCEVTGAEVFLKLENRQLSGSFKLRGVFNKLLSMSPEQSSRPLVAASTGNHGAAFAYAVRELGLDGTLFLPTNAARKKLAAIEASGISYQLVGDDCIETELHAARIAEQEDLVLVPPYNDPEVVAGQGTIAVELLEQLEEIDAVLAPVGGGGLISGIATYLSAVAPKIEVIACQPQSSPVMYESVRAGRIVEMESLPTLSDATAGGIEPGSITFDLCRRHVQDYVLLSEEEIADAVRFVHEHEDMVIEGGAALTVAAAIKRRRRLKGKTVVLVITGSKIDDEVLRRILR
jgi:threonine dehydratase